MHLKDENGETIRGQENIAARWVNTLKISSM